MPQVRVRQKHQITIPARIAEAAHIKPDDVLDVSYANGVVTLIPANRKEYRESVMAYAGIAHGVWGKITTEIDAGLQAARDSWER